MNTCKTLNIFQMSSVMTSHSGACATQIKDCAENLFKLIIQGDRQEKVPRNDR